MTKIRSVVLAVLLFMTVISLFSCATGSAIPKISLSYSMHKFPFKKRSIRTYQSLECLTPPNSDPIYARVKGAMIMWLKRVNGMAINIISPETI